MKKTDLIQEIESLAVDEISVNKFGHRFQVYPILKSRWFHKAIMDKEVMKEKNIKELFSQITSIFYGFFNFFRRYDIWVFSNSSERVLLNGKYEDKLFDYIAQDKRFKSLIIEQRLFQKYKRSKVATKHVVSKSLLMLIEEVIILLLKKRYKIQNESILHAVESKIGVTINYDVLIRKHLAQYLLMRFILRCVPKPKIVFLSVSYAHFGYIRAFKERGIKVVEMQHGMIGKGHDAYYYTIELDPIQFPDEIMVLGEDDKQHIQNDSKFPVKKIHVVGSYIVDFYLDTVEKRTDELQSISVALQDGNLSLELIDFILECDMETDSKFQWIIKTRRTSEDEYRKIYRFPPNITFSTKGIYETIAANDVHLTIFSTTALEAVSLGRTTILLDNKGKASHYLGNSLGDNPNVSFLKNANDFVQFSKGYQSIDPIEISLSNNRNIKSGFKKNIDTYLTQLNAEFIKK